VVLAGLCGDLLEGVERQQAERDGAQRRPPDEERPGGGLREHRDLVGRERGMAGPREPTRFLGARGVGPSFPSDEVAATPDLRWRKWSSLHGFQGVAIEDPNAVRVALDHSLALELAERSADRLVTY